jgi:hypothetical protein
VITRPSANKPVIVGAIFGDIPSDDVLLPAAEKLEGADWATFSNTHAGTSRGQLHRFRRASSYHHSLREFPYSRASTHDFGQQT